ncbi:TPA: McrC family protein [Pseudomonas aeruginosa]|uniref:McrC family protein n=1 Tax=Pseudomonas aeruginosa TaxID=287 RepID=UPI000E30E79D|nr:restriction endonuclease [Pseudomonas aeruginosa]NPX94446.1 restriction endonuclease [Pseudomonas aeruginosa]
MMLMQVLEHEWLPIRAGGGQSLGLQQAALLERLADSLPAKALEWRRTAVKFTQFCGVIQLGELTIEVLPKIARHERDAQLCRQVLVRLLQLTGSLPLHSIGEASLGQQRHALLDVFIEHFRSMIAQQMQLGLIRRYVPIQDELSTVRGRIDLVRQVRLNAFTPQRIQCRFDEFDIDNPCNQVLRHVLGLLLRRTQHPGIKRGINELLIHLAAVSDRTFTSEQVEGLTFDRLNQRWQPVFQRCADFLRALHPNVTAGGLPALALLFDMNRLFEGYVTWRMRRTFKDHQIQAQGPRRYLAVNQAGYEVFQLRPDISVLQGKQVVAIADAKWKILKPEERKQGISAADLYQLTSYAQRYQCQRLALIYPVMEGIKPGLRDRLMIKDADVQLSIYSIDLAGVLLTNDAVFEHLSSWVVER